MPFSGSTVQPKNTSKSKSNRHPTQTFIRYFKGNGPKTISNRPSIGTFIPVPTSIPSPPIATSRGPNRIAIQEVAAEIVPFFPSPAIESSSSPVRLPRRPGAHPGDCHPQLPEPHAFHPRPPRKHRPFQRRTHADLTPGLLIAIRGFPGPSRAVPGRRVSAAPLMSEPRECSRPPRASAAHSSVSAAGCCVSAAWSHTPHPEVELLTRLRSPYLLSLIGHCSEGGHRLLVYEFMANGGLQEHLYPRDTCGGTSKLNWDTRLRIALEAAKGLEYLHERVNPPVIHRDFKSSNILLDKDFHARVSDFGLAKLGSDRAGGHVSTRVLGTQGYVAPEYALTGHLTTKSDVYSYGVVLLELLTGRVPVDMKRPSGEGVLVNWALPMLTDREKVVRILDPGLEGQYSLKDAVQVAAIAAMCVQPEADYRPLMADVVQSLVPLVKSRSTQKTSNPIVQAPKPLD